MPKRSRKTKTQKPQDKSKNYVAVTHADDVEQAREYEALLKANDIPVAIRKHNSDCDEDRDFAVMVPENFLDEAYAIIESQDVYDDDYNDFALEENDDDLELDPDLLDGDNY